MNKVLIISLHFAPFNNSGAYRTLKFVKYLPENGWQPIVLTCKNPGTSYRDADLLNDIPPCAKIYQVWRPDIRKLTPWITALLYRLRKERRPSRPLNPKTASGHKTQPGMASRIFHAIFVPDEMITWIPWAAIKAIRLCRKENIKVLYTTSPPPSVHLIGYLVSRLRRVWWVADFRDKWIDNVSRQRVIGSLKWPQRVDAWLEKRVVAAAGVVIANTNIDRKLLIERYREETPHKFQVIHNGFDWPDLRGINGHARPHEKLVISFAGNLYEGMSEAFFAALEEILAVHRDWAEKIQLHLIGTQETLIIRQLAQQRQLGKILSFHGKLPKCQALEQLAQSDVLLYFSYPDDAAAGWVPSKLFEYCMFGKPIWGVGFPGEAAEILREAHLGTMVNPFERDAIEKQLLAYVRQFESGKLEVAPNEKYLHGFARHQQTKKLVELFNPDFAM
jgi:glycosyltransferase involved in cell wall biosynthesis